MIKTFPTTTWRLILSEPLSGRENMAIDSAILAAVGRGESPPTLRLYRWNPPCISLGYSQPYSDLDQDLLEGAGWEVVRRPTGGRAILHTDELTYAVIGPKSDPRLEGGLMDSYQNISRALFETLSDLGLPVEVHTGKNPKAHHQPVCFENPSDFEITADGKKIIGSAQARKKDCLLQHGSLPLMGRLDRITQVLAYPSEKERIQAGDILLSKAATIYDVLGKVISWEEAAQVLVDSFSTILNLDLIEGSLTEKEKAGAIEQEATRYGNPEWTRGTLPKRGLV